MEYGHGLFLITFISIFLMTNGLLCNHMNCPEQYHNLVSCEMDSNLQKILKYEVNGTTLSIFYPIFTKAGVSNTTVDNLEIYNICIIEKNTFPEKFDLDIKKVNKFIWKSDDIGFEPVFEIISKLDNFSSILQSLSIIGTNGNQIRIGSFGKFGKLLKLELINNSIEIIGGNFSDLHDLAELSLASNKINLILPNAFDGLINLKILNLEGNLIEDIGGQFNSLKKLQVLNLRNNKIANLENLLTLPSLKWLDVSQNNLENIDISFILFGNLTTLNLNNNKIKQLNLHRLLSKSEQFFVNLIDNPITSISFKGLDDLNKTGLQYGKSIISVNSTSFQCDCKNYDLFFHIYNTKNPIINKHFEIESNQLQCATPEKYANTLVEAVDFKDIADTCSVKCSDECDCTDLIDNFLIIDCSNRSLKVVPKLNLPMNRNDLKIKVLLQNNLIEKFTKENSMYEMVTDLDLSNNSLKELSWIPMKLQRLNLSWNKLELVEEDIVKNFTGIITLDHNPWKCDCKTIPLIHYVKEHITPNKIEILCTINLPLVAVQDDDICHPTRTIFNIIMLLVSLVGLIASSFCLIRRCRRRGHAAMTM